MSPSATQKQEFLAKSARLQRVNLDELRRLRDQVCASIAELSWINKALEAALLVELNRRLGLLDHNLFNRVFFTVEDLSIFDDLRPGVAFRAQSLHELKTRDTTKVLVLGSKFGEFVSSQEYNRGILRKLGEHLEVVIASRQPIDNAYSSTFKSYKFEYPGDARRLCTTIRPDKVVDLTGDHHEVMCLLARDFHVADLQGQGQSAGVEHTSLFWPDAKNYLGFLPRPIRADGVNRLYVPPEGSLRRYPQVDPSARIGSADVVLGAFCRTAKLSLNVIRVWSEIMISHPNSRLLFAFIQSNTTSEKFVKDIFTKFGVGDERVSFLPRCDTTLYLSQLNAVDISLGAMPEQGGISCLDSLVMGCPYLVCEELSSTLASSIILDDLGLGDWSTKTETEYRSLIGDMIINVELFRRNQFRKTVRSRVLDSPLARADGVADVWRRFLQAEVEPQSWSHQ